MEFNIYVYSYIYIYIYTEHLLLVSVQKSKSNTFSKVKKHFGKYVTHKFADHVPFNQNHGVYNRKRCPNE